MHATSAPNEFTKVQNMHRCENNDLPYKSNLIWRICLYAELPRAPMLQQPKGLEHGAHIAGLHITEIMTLHYETFGGNRQNAQKVHMFQRPQI